MTREEILTALDEVFQEEFDDDTIHVTEATVAADIEDWDSLEHINLIVAVEKRFHLRFTMGEVTGMKNVGEMVSIILQRGK